MWHCQPGLVTQHDFPTPMAQTIDGSAVSGAESPHRPDSMMLRELSTVWRLVSPGYYSPTWIFLANNHYLFLHPHSMQQNSSLLSTSFPITPHHGAALAGRKSAAHLPPLSSQGMGPGVTYCFGAWRKWGKSTLHDVTTLLVDGSHHTV